MSQIRIAELPEITSVTDEVFLPVDDGNLTRKITVGNFNEGANTSARQYAIQAAASAVESAQSATEAAQALADMDVRVASVAQIATRVNETALAAATSAEAANYAAENAAASSSSASSHATAAETSAQSVEGIAKLSESYAKGGTGIRYGEDTDNAKYYASQAASAAGGGVLSFNGRGGHVSPEIGDYTATMISRGTSNVDADLSALESGLQTTNGNVHTAQTTANNAASAAATADGKAVAAQSAASAAQSAASAAQTTADGAASTASAAQTAVDNLGTRLDNSHKQYLKTLGLNWTLAAGGTWDGYYYQTLNLTAIYNGAGDVDARGATLATPPSDEVKAAVSQMYFLVDDTAKTLTAYTKTAPTVACNISVEGMV